MWNGVWLTDSDLLERILYALVNGNSLNLSFRWKQMIWHQLLTISRCQLGELRKFYTHIHRLRISLQFLGIYLRIKNSNRSWKCAIFIFWALHNQKVEWNLDQWDVERRNSTLPRIGCQVLGTVPSFYPDQKAHQDWKMIVKKLQFWLKLGQISVQ